MAIVGNMSTWKNRLAGATDAELSTLYRQTGDNFPLRPLIADEVSRRSGLPSVAQPTGLTSLGPTRSVRGVADDPAAAGPGAFATMAFDAWLKQDTDTALKLYDAGLDRYGSEFAATFDTLKAASQDQGRGPLKPVESIAERVVSPEEGERLGADLREPRTTSGVATASPVAVASPVATTSGVATASPIATASPVATTSGVATAGPVATRIVSPAEGERLASGLGSLPTEETGAVPRMSGLPGARPPPSVNETALPEPPEPAPYLPQGADAAVKQMLRETELAGSQYRADQVAAENVRRAKVLDAATLDAKALVEAGLTPEAAIEEARKQPGVADVVSVDALRAGLGLPQAEAAPTAATGQPKLPEGAIEYVPGTGDAVAPSSPGLTFQPPAVSERGLPRPDRPIVAPRGSGGLSTFAAPKPIRVAPAPPRPAAEGPPAPSTPEPAVKNAAAAPEEPAEEGPSPYWEALMQAGLGTMASQNDSVLGAIGEGGMAGVKRLGEIRKERREELRDKSEAAYRKGSLENQREGINVQREGIASLDRRSERELQSRERLHLEDISSRERVANAQIASAYELKGAEIQSQRDLLFAKADVEFQLLVEKERLEREGKKMQREDAFNFLHKDPKGPLLPKEASGTLAMGFAPTKADKPTPMDEKETEQALDLVAVNMFGEGYTGKRLVAELPDPVRIEFMEAISSRPDSGGASAAAMAVLRKYRIGPKDRSIGGGLFGTDMTLTQPKAPPATGNLTYVPGKGAVPQ